MSAAHGPAPARTEPIGPRLQEVVCARAVLASARASGDAEETRRSRQVLRDALIAFTTALSDQRLPVPYTVRDELRLLRHVPW